MCVYGLCVVCVKYVQRSCVFVCEVWGVCEVYVMCVCGLCVVGDRGVWQLSVICYLIRQSLGRFCCLSSICLRFSPQLT